MNQEHACCQALPEKPSLRRFLKRYWGAVKTWLYLNIWCRYCYRHVMRFAHRYNWHYAPPGYLRDTPNQNNHWCQWCGLRGTTYTNNDKLP